MKLVISIKNGNSLVFDDADQGRNLSSASSKVKTLAAVDVEKVNSIKECVEKVVTEARLQQGLEHLTQNQLDHDPKNMGEFLKWISTDLAKEEMDTITESGLEFKEVVKEAQRVARNWFFKQL